MLAASTSLGRLALRRLAAHAPRPTTHAWPRATLTTLGTPGEGRWPPSPSLFPLPGPNRRGPTPAPPLPPNPEQEGAEGPPRTPPPRKGDPLEDLDTVTCRFESGQQAAGGTATTAPTGGIGGGGGWGSDYATYSPGGAGGVGFGVGGEGGKGVEGVRAGWMDEEAKEFVKVVRATDPRAPCPQCVTGEHHVCSTSLSDADDAYEMAAGPAGSAIDPEERKRIVLARAHDMDDERANCTVPEQHEVLERIEEERCGWVEEDPDKQLLDPAFFTHEGDTFRRAGQMRITREVGAGDNRGMIKTAGYGSSGSRETGKGYGDVFWEGGEPIMHVEEVVMVAQRTESTEQLPPGATSEGMNPRLHAAEQEDRAREQAPQQERMEGRGGDRDVEEREAFPREDHQPPKQPPDVLRRLRQQGEMSELRDDEGPGGDALPDTVRAQEQAEAKRAKRTRGGGKGSKKAAAAAAGAGKREQKEEGTDKGKGAEEGMAASVDATLEPTVTLAGKMVKTAVKESLPLPVRVVVNEVEKAVDRSGGETPSMPKLIKSIRENPDEGSETKEEGKKEK